MILANFLEANNPSYSFLAPVQTILPDLKIKAVVLGSLNLIITPWNLEGLNSEFRVLAFIVSKSRVVCRSTVETQFLKSRHMFNILLQKQTNC